MNLLECQDCKRAYSIDHFDACPTCTMAKYKTLRTTVEGWRDELGEEPVRSYTTTWHHWNNTREAYQRVLDMLDGEGTS